MSEDYVVPTVEGLDYYLIDQPEPLGAPHAEEVAEIPKIFTPVSVRGVTFPNRIGVSPMCMYSADDAMRATPYHLVHYGGLAMRGPGLIIVESTAVSPEGGLSPHDLSIHTDEHALKLKEVVDYCHGFKAVMGIQLGHGGRKANGQPPFVHLEQNVSKKAGGWPDKTIAPSAIEFRPNGNYVRPHELTNAEVKGIIKKFGDAADRAVNIAGFDFVEIHGAHGYLVNEFYSANSNKRTDEYGGSFENRIRFLLEVAQEIRSRVGEKVPIAVRVSASENDSTNPDAWTIEDTVKLTKYLVDVGIDIIDVSSGGNSYKQDRRGTTSFVHAELATTIKKAVGDKLIVACVGAIDDPEQANKRIVEGDFDIALIGKNFLRNPGLVWEWGDKLGVRLNQTLQYDWGFHPKIQGIVDLMGRASLNIDKK